MRRRSFWRDTMLMSLAFAAGAGLGLVVLARSYSAHIEVKGKDLFVQGETMAALIAAATAPDADSGPDPIQPERVAPIVRRLMPGAETRARIFDRDGALIIDSAGLVGSEPRSDAMRLDEWLLRGMRWLAPGGPLPSRIVGMDGAHAYPEVEAAMTGSIPDAQLLVENGEEIVSVAVPIQSRQALQGVLLLTARTRT